MPHIILFNKPFNVLSQFSDETDRLTLRHFLNLPEHRGFYPAGRLDRDSEGLLLLTDDGTLQARISHPREKTPKTYWAQVEGEPNEAAIEQLQHGISLNDGPTAPAQVRLMTPPSLWDRTPPIRYRAHIPTHWLEITITEGRNRQVRRMTAAVNLPTLRLVRVRIGEWHLDELQPGQFKCATISLTRSPETRNRRRNSQ